MITKGKAYDILMDLLEETSTSETVSLMCNHFNTDELWEFIQFIKKERK